MHDSRKPLLRRPKWTRPPPSMVFLLLGILLLVGAAWQAHRTARSQQLTALHVLQNYAGVAAWNFEQHITPAFRESVEPLFHPLHDVSFADGRVAPYSITTLLGDRADLGICGEELIAATRYGARFPLRGDAVETTAPLPDGVLRELQAAVRANYLSTPAADRITGHEQVQALRLADTAVVVLYSPKVVPDDTLLYALVLDPALLAPAFERVLAARQLLPESLLNGATNEQLLKLSLLLPDGGGVVYGSAATSARTGERAMPRLGGLIAMVELLPEAERHLLLSGSPFTSGPFLIAVLSVAIGLLVVAFSQIRREYALARLRSDFVSSVSHELRTPLALQRVFLDMLRLGRVDTPERRQWCFDNIDRESARLAHLVENVLHFSRAEQGTMRVAAQRTRLSPLLADIVHAFEPLAAAGGTTIVGQLADVEATADAGALRQIMMNLLENAVKYGPGSQQISVTLSLARGGVARITVDDQGDGVPPAEREAIFEPFRRGAATMNSAVAGSGIGLAVVRELVRRQGGRVYVRTAPSGGARFVVELPHAALERGEGRSYAFAHA